MQAKEFLVSRIVEEANRQRVQLSELERKMLYFSELYPTLPDMMEVAERFEAECDDAKYEVQIKKLSKKAFVRDRTESPENVQRWRAAIRALRKEDHYILVMLDVPRSSADIGRLVITGLIVAALLLGTLAALDWADHHVHIRVPDYVSILTVVLIFVLVYYLALSNKGVRVNDHLMAFVERVVRWF